VYEVYVYEPNKQDDEEIWNAENGTDWLEEESEEEEWGNDVYGCYLYIPILEYFLSSILL
jgi:hypothetical protein